MRIRAGELTQKVTIRRLQAGTADGAGGLTADEWEDHRVEFAHVIPRSGREAMAADRMEATAGYTFVFRARTDIREADKLLWRDREFNIRHLPARGPRELYIYVETDLGVAI